MADLVVIADPDEATAEAARPRPLEMRRECPSEMGDAVFAVRQPDGRLKRRQLSNMTAAGAASGALWGALVGLIRAAARRRGGGCAFGRVIEVGFVTEAAETLRPGQGRSACSSAR